MTNPYEWREPGEALWPERYSVADLKKIKAVSARDWDALYMGRPTSAKGAIFKRTEFRYWYPYKMESRRRPVPIMVDGQDYPQPLIQLPHESEIESYVLSGDLTFKGKADSDNIALGVWAKVGNKEFLIDSITKKAGFTDTLTAIGTLLRKWPRINAVLIEDAANGPAIIETLKKIVPAVLPRPTLGGKEARAQAVHPRFEAGEVYFPHPTLEPWVGELERELVSFPTGRHDDQVDQLTHYLAWRNENKGGLDRMISLSLL